MKSSRYCQEWNNSNLKWSPTEYRKCRLVTLSPRWRPLAYLSKTEPDRLLYSLGLGLLRSQRQTFGGSVPAVGVHASPEGRRRPTSANVNITAQHDYFTRTLSLKHNLLLGLGAKYYRPSIRHMSTVRAVYTKD